MTLGILTGKSTDKIATDFLRIMGTNRKSAVRAARTAVTSAQNAGCQSAFDQAEKMGISMKKEWMCTHDTRTRTSHINMDGQRVDNDATFSNGLRYPGDPNGAPAEVYNCRCTMRAILPAMIKAGDADRKLYKDWLKEQQTESESQAREQHQIEGENVYGTNAPRGIASIQNILQSALNKDDDNGNIKVSESKYTGMSNPLKYDLNKENVEVNGTKYPARIKEQKQNEHIAGTKEYYRREQMDAERAKNKSGAKNGHHSEFLSTVDVVKLISEAQKHQTGRLADEGRGTTEFFTAEKDIGYYYTGGKKVPTNQFGIKFSKDGCHAFPVQPKE